MAIFKVYKLHFTTPVHFGDCRGDYGISQRTIQSDTLYAALTSSLSKLGIEIPGNGDLGFTISSLFPYYQIGEHGQPVYFLPRPKKLSLLEEKDIEQRKKIKKISWLDVKYFEEVINGCAPQHVLASDIQGEFLSYKKIDDKFICNQTQERVTVSRTGIEDAKPFYMDRVAFKEYSGLYFIAEGNTALLDKALSLLQYEGIGTDRNVGNGIFKYQTDNIEIKLPDSYNGQMSLSIYIPSNQEELDLMLAGKNLAYDFVRRGGWITTYPYNTLRKNFVYAFTPASVFGLYSPTETKGKIVDLGVDVPGLNHPIYRCGRSLFIPINI